MSITIATKEWGRVRLQHLPVKGVSEHSYHKSLFVHFTPSTPDGMSRMQIYLDCKWQGYFMMPLSLYQMAKEAAGNKIRAERDRKVKVQVIRNSSLQKALEEASCPPANDAQAIQPSSKDYYGINGETDHLLQSLSELTSVLKEMRRYMDMQTRETKLLRDTLERCEMCRAHKHCKDNPCYPGVQCADSADGFRCGPCPRDHVGDGITCKQVVTCNSKPCYEGVQCYDADNGYRCGPCPPGFTGNGLTCKPANRCNENPCWSGVQCVNTDTVPGYICGPCPPGYTGNGSNCEDIDEVANQLLGSFTITHNGTKRFRSCRT
ncbi:hypothetical protein JTE90_015755 [Oedothorax gibbosus]|uniref:EGF-like domain-containing protein n=1 Tax=Oedothorax gibbosus TaxID=931172 RepID=A0AAV6VXF2_9ARAC|nr:hypothetical protein JTE90_015755 [Oedothorax gibbosus]